MCVATVAREKRGWQFARRSKTMATGTVKWFNAEKGFGFIAPDDGSADVFAHFSAIASSGYRSLDENQKVQFDITQGPKGTRAENISSRSKWFSGSWPAAKPASFSVFAQPCCRTPSLMTAPKNCQPKGNGSRISTNSLRNSGSVLPPSADRAQVRAAPLGDGRYRAGLPRESPFPALA